MRRGLSINPSANLFVFADFDVHRKDWLTNFGRTDRPGELCYDFSISNDLTQMVNFPNRIPDCYHHNHALLNFFLSSDNSICSRMAFPPLEILIMLLSLFPLTFRQTQKEMSCLIA